MRSIPLLLLLLVFFPSQVWGQEKPVKKGPVFRIVCWSDWNDKKIYIKDRTKPDKKGKEKEVFREIKLLRLAYSSHYTYKKGEPIVFYKKTEDPENPYAPVLSVSIPDGNAKPIIFLRITKNKSTKAKVPVVKGNTEVPKYKFYSLVLDNDPKIFPYGSYRIVNFTKKGLKAILGKEKVTIAPGRRAVVTPKNPNKVSIPVIIYAQGEKKPIFDALDFIHEDERVLLFVALKRNTKGEMRPRCSPSVGDSKD